MLALETHESGERLVLVRGLATMPVIWRRVLPYLAGEVTALDVPRFGASPPRAGDRPGQRRALQDEARQRFGQAMSFVAPGIWHRSLRAGPLPLRIVIVVTLVM
jgi:hypothetical protein